MAQWLGMFGAGFWCENIQLHEGTTMQTSALISRRTSVEALGLGVDLLAARKDSDAMASLAEPSRGGIAAGMA